ncbi:hypothetical protein NUW58_g10572 [Xylaria curta]|uniref:Uncharacterized protein n=1 Tax=Xylaria curta TaxID=42375 RepID=A0ACC1MJ77_9PEZI|nr:hypothetical protein NUW58_g10572 [Xylaria curta]
MGISDELLIAVPNTLTTEAVDIFQLPTQERRSTVHLGSKTEKKGMVMALSLFWRRESLFLLAGCENGLAVVARPNATTASRKTAASDQETNPKARGRVRSMFWELAPSPLSSLLRACFGCVAYIRGMWLGYGEF